MVVVDTAPCGCSTYFVFLSRALIDDAQYDLK